ncbi:SAM-dependent methyltransferase [Actinomadura sp. 7K507]|uniref:SAM-dependent methyltransferase n=1 Tax=Actinomadura sp. 7K507 TaxID=2530365 RepID=UPI00104DAE5D|nr:SAM-dependent methyltransferase [Actinomadura sp. 7K507]TDC91959.1 SAM-dependent methyltransferase [Actinomadura sp. 7K507]
MTGGAYFSWDPHLPDTPGFDWAAAKRDLCGFDTATPSMSRVWHFWLGGKDRYSADRCFGEYAEALYPQIVDVAHHRIAFRARAVRAMVGEYGIGQILVAGVDLPLRDEVHDIAHRLDPLVRVVYADADPWVMVHARALLDSGWADGCVHLDAGPADPEVLLSRAAEVVYLAEPVGVLLINSLDGLDDPVAAHVIGVLGGALPHGSCVAICQLTGQTGEGLAALGSLGARRIPGLPHARTPAGVRALFAGLELVGPGVVSASQWRPEPSPWQPGPVDLWCGLGRVMRDRAHWPATTSGAMRW